MLVRYEKVSGELPVEYNTSGNSIEDTLDTVDLELKQYGLEVVIADVGGYSEVFFKIVKRE